MIQTKVENLTSLWIIWNFTLVASAICNIFQALRRTTVGIMKLDYGPATTISKSL